MISLPDRDLYISLRLLDRRVVDAHGEPLGRVDDLAFEQVGDAIRLVSIVMGPEALGARLGGTLGVLVAGAARWRPEGASAPEVPLADIDSADVEVRLRQTREALPFPRSEGWVRDHVVDRLPGARRSSSAGEVPGGSAASTGTGTASADDPPSDPQHRLMASGLLGTTVVDRDGRALGKARDLRISGPQLEVTQIITGRGVVAERFGYLQGEVTGPWLLVWLLGRARRRTRAIPWADVEDVGPDAIRVRGSADGYGPVEVPR